MTTDLVLLGAGGTCADVLAIVEAVNSITFRYRCVGLLDDSAELRGTSQFGLPVLGTISDTSCPEGVLLVDCLGGPQSFRERESFLGERGLAKKSFATLVSPTAFIANDANMGSGCIIYPNTVIMAGVRLGHHVTILANCVLNHHAIVGDYSIITSGVNVSGRVSIGRACYVGAGASLSHNVTVGDGALIGLGSAVIRDVPQNSVVAGNPAKQLRTFKSKP